MQLSTCGRALRRTVLAGAMAIAPAAHADVHMINRTGEMLTCSLTGGYETESDQPFSVSLFESVLMVQGQVANGWPDHLWRALAPPGAAFVGVEVSCLWRRAGGGAQPDRMFSMRKILSRDRGFFTTTTGMFAGLPTAQRDLVLIILRTDDSATLPGFALLGAVKGDPPPLGFAQAQQGLGYVAYREIRRLAVEPRP